MKKITRRKFVQTSATAAAAVAILPTQGCSGSRSPFDPKGLPTVELGNTGEKVPLMGFGCGSRWMAVESDDQALGMLQYALDQGLYYWDTAASYGNDRISSEERIGKILPGVRDRVFLVTKTGDRDAGQARESIERSLQRLQTDYIDLVHVHSIQSAEDSEQLGEKGKVLEVLHELRKAGTIRHIGFTGHTSAAGMKRAAELYDFEVMMIALNHQKADGSEDFENEPAPYAFGKGMGVVGMKVFRPRETVASVSSEDLFNYALSLDSFHMVNVGIDRMELLKANLEMIRGYSPMEPEKMEEVRMALRPFFMSRDLAWMQPGYTDGWSGPVRLA